MASKYYAVRVGRKTGIFEDVNQYLSYTRGYPGAIGRGFKTIEGAQRFMEVESCERPELEYVEGPLTNKPITAYVDGSYSYEEKKAAYGIVLKHRKKELFLSGYVDDERAEAQMNVGAEFYAAVQALKYAQINQCKSITILHDLKTISDVAKGKARARGYAAIYKSVYDEVSKQIPVYFTKVNSHSSNKHVIQRYNNIADSLARNVLGHKTKKMLMDHVEQVLLTTVHE